VATYVALLYSVVLTPQRRVVMADLRQMVGQLGLKQVRTLAATGNLVFEAPETATAELEGRLEAAFEEKFGRHVDIVVRTSEAWSRLAACNPFPDEASATPDQVAVRVMRHPVPAGAEGRLGEAAAADEKFRIVGGDIWIVFSRARPNSRLLAASNHRRFGVGTSRNWNTVRNLAQMLE
jgi:uncharacterized protein (DUF1697 family)